MPVLLQDEAIALCLGGARLSIDTIVHRMSDVTSSLIRPPSLSLFLSQQNRPGFPMVKKCLPPEERKVRSAYSALRVTLLAAFGNRVGTPIACTRRAPTGHTQSLGASKVRHCKNIVFRESSISYSYTWRSRLL